MAPQGFTLFETAIGHCGVAWSPRGLVGVQLPEGRPAATRARMRRRWAEADERRPPKEVQAAVDSMVSLLAGRPADLLGRRARHGRRAELPPARLRGGPHHPCRTDPRPTERSRPLARPARRRPSGRRWDATRSPSSCRAIAWWRRAARRAASRPRAASRRSSRSWPSRERPSARTKVSFDVDDDGEPGFDSVGAVEHLRAVDPVLARTIDACGPFELRVAPTPSVFVALAEAIVYQQLHRQGGSHDLRRVGALFPGRGTGHDPSRSCGPRRAAPRRRPLRAKCWPAGPGPALRRREIPTLGRLARMTTTRSSSG